MIMPSIIDCNKAVIISDLHLEFDSIIRHITPDANKLLIIAGDVAEISPSSLNNIKNDLLHLAKFKHVISILGNHEHYGNDVTNTESIFNSWLKENNITNWTILNDSAIETSNSIIYGSTYWTPIAPDKEQLINMYMNDYRAIRFNNKALTPVDTTTMHYQHREKLIQFLNQRHNKKVIIITHHAVHPLSVHEQYKNDPCNSAFVSNQDDVMVEYKPSVWVHGHVHNSFDYVVDETRVICNPKGYGNENEEWDKRLVIDV